MCELLAMSASHATSVNHSLALLRPRGGELGPHADGWGVAFYEGCAARIFKEPVPAAESRCLAFITEYNFQSATVIAHIRKAKPSHIGRKASHTHPFEREYLGRSWVFAHNGQLPGLLESTDFTLGRFRPLGETDSEYAFCLILEALTASHYNNQNQNSLFQLVEIIRPLVRKLANFGEFNFILSDGKHLIAYAHTHLHVLQRLCTEHGCEQKVTLLATSPLTDEPWVPLANNEIYIFADGEAVIPAEESQAPANFARRASIPQTSSLN